MKVTVNGAPLEIPPGTTLEQLLEQLGHRAAGVAVAVNLEFVPRSHHLDRELKEADEIEIVAPIAGG
jgi:thiamine biosynthesis protein ThiS